MKTARQIIWWLAALGLIPGGAGAKPPTVPEGYTIEAYVTKLVNPTAMAFSPGGKFGYEGELFVADSGAGGRIYRAPRKGAKVVFVAKTTGAPLGMAFAPAGSKFAPYLYALHHGQDLKRYDSKGAAHAFGKAGQHSLVLAFAPGGKWGRDLYHLDSFGDTGGDKVLRWTAEGKSVRVVGGLREDLLGIAFSPGKRFGDYLYLAFASWPSQSNAIRRLGPDGKTSPFLTSPEFRRINVIAADTTWNFRGNLFVGDYMAGKIFEIDARGNVKTFLTGLRQGQSWQWAGGDIVFGPDGAMYVADGGAQTIWRIAPNDLGLRRSPFADLVLLAGADPVKGTITNESFSVQTAYGLVKLPAEKVVGMTARKDRTVELLLVDGQVVCGKFPAGKLNIKLPDGASRQIATDRLKLWSFKISKARPRKIVSLLPAAVLRTGDHLAFDTKGSAFKLRTPGGVVALAAKDLLEIAGGKDDKAKHTVRFTNGSILRGTLEPAEITPALAGGRKLTLGREIVALRFSAEKSPVTWLTRVDLAGGDMLWGQIANEKLKFRTGDGLVEVRPADVKKLSMDGTGEGEADLALWSGKRLVGHLEAETIAFRISPGPKLAVAVKQIVGIVRATPFPPDRVAESVERLVERLGDDSYKVREQATKLLMTLGPPLRGFLEKHRDHRDLEVRERIKIILAGPRKPAR